MAVGRILDCVGVGRCVVNNMCEPLVATYW
jgi:hypothetical protein